MVKLSPYKKRKLKKEFESRLYTTAELAKKYGISRPKIYRLATKGKWKNLKKENAKPKVGRPTKYKPEYCQQATALCMLGFTNEKLAQFFDVSEETIYDWQRTKKEFSEALLNGRDKASAKVAISLFQRACGYSHQEEKIFQHDGEIIRAETTKHYPPEVKAIALWLKNKFPDLWRDKQEIEGDFTARAVVGKISEEDVEVVKDILSKIVK